MSLEKTDTIDVMGVENDAVILTLLDSHDWSDEKTHLHLLQEKLNSYLRFIESGEIDQVYPNGRGLKRIISIIAKYQPSDLGLDFLRNAKGAIQNAGFDFMFEVR